MSTELDETGPIDYLVVEFPGSRMTGEGLPLLVDLVDSGIIRILDLVFVERKLDGSVTAVEIADFDHDGTLDLAVFEGASSGLLGEDDVNEAASAVEPGNSAGILVYENVWAAPFAAALRRGGAQLVASGRIPVQAILAALDAAEAAETDAVQAAGTTGLSSYHSTDHERLIPCQGSFAGSPAPQLSREPLPPSPDVSTTASRESGPLRNKNNKPPTPNRPHPPHRSLSTRHHPPPRARTTSWPSSNSWDSSGTPACSPTPSSKPRRARFFTHPDPAA